MFLPLCVCKKEEECCHFTVVLRVETLASNIGKSGGGLPPIRLIDLLNLFRSVLCYTEMYVT